MIKFLRLLFGQPSPAGKRTVVGQANAVDVKEVKYTQDSSARLNLLNNLCNKYKGMPHEAKIKSVYEKTKSIHTFLIAKKRGPELELFHLQHTDHFINTFGIIAEVHQRYQESIFSSAQSNQVPENIPSAPNGRPEPVMAAREPAQRAGSPAAFNATLKTEAAVPTLPVPVISINTFARIPYVHADTLGSLSAREISFTAAEPEKELFLAEVSARLGIQNIVYLGNALVNIPQSTQDTTTPELVPVIRWQHSVYALYLKDFRLFPVKINW